jgi:hypothetical protein
MKSIKTRDRIALIVHPNDPDVQIKVRKLERLQKMRFFAKVREEQAVRVIRDGEEILFEDDGITPKVFIGSSDFPINAILHLLEAVYVEGSAKGIFGEDGKPVDVTLRNVDVLLSEELDIVPDGDGERPYPLWMFIFRRVIDDATFELDPKA